MTNLPTPGEAWRALLKADQAVFAATPLTRPVALTAAQAARAVWVDTLREKRP